MTSTSPADDPRPLNDLLQVGDIVFIRVGNFLYRRVAEATLSWTSHVGMVHHRKDGEWMIAESAVPRSRYCSLPRFIRRSQAGMVSIKRLRASPDATAQRQLADAAARRMGLWYHLGFKLDSRLQFCSKFVYEVYRDALGIDVGTVETFRQLLSKNPNNSMAFWRCWFLGRIPWDRRTVTPAAVYESPLLVTVYENLPASFRPQPATVESGRPLPPGGS